MAANARRIVIATGNAGKLREIRALLDETGFEIVPQASLGIEPAPETGDTFLANALQKARHAAMLAGLAAIADDSGLVVPALDGEPGVRSARYAGEDATDRANNEKLLAELDGIDDLRAHFHCAAVYVRTADDPAPLVAEASWHGVITGEPSGSGGFGYDPLFFVPDYGCTSAELPAATKNELSHRGRAVRELARRIRASLGDT